MATGPHLDYRMTLNGVVVDPLTTQIPPAAPIPPHEHEAFETARAAYGVAARQGIECGVGDRGCVRLERKSPVNAGKY